MTSYVFPRHPDTSSIMDFPHLNPLLQALNRLSFGGSTIKDTVVAQSRILLFWYYTTYLMLEKNKPKFQLLEPPPHDQIQTPLKLEPLESETEEPYEPPESPLSDQGKPDQPLQSPPSEPLNLFGLDGL